MELSVPPGSGTLFEGAKLAPGTNAHAQRNQDFELETIATVKTIAIST